MAASMVTLLHNDTAGVGSHRMRGRKAVRLVPTTSSGSSGVNSAPGNKDV